MRYWQITTRRLSQAQHKLLKDGEWHPFGEQARSYYRVWQNKIVQRVSFESDEEERALFDAVKNIQPFRDTAGTEGFREELRFVFRDDHIAMLHPLGYVLPEEQMKMFERVCEHFGAVSKAEGNLLWLEVQVAEITNAAIVRSQETIARLKLEYQSLK
jgi:hypothetical protein